MAENPTLEIISDDAAYIVKGAVHVPLEGGYARRIISAWRHCLSHEGTGETDAQVYLWGLIDGMQHANAIEMERLLDDVRSVDRARPPPEPKPE